jgi:dTDP-4-dehydrorhamnose 3,5-epimerase
MIFKETDIPDIWMIEPDVFGDSRGYFMEAYKRTEFERFIGTCDFMQDNESCSAKGVWRGFHYQLEPFAQSKLVRIIQGVVLDVAVDIRKGSPTFGQYVAVELSGENKRQLFIPKGFAHGFYVMSETALFTYKVDNPYMPAYERAIRYDDPAIGIEKVIPQGQTVVLSDKDRQAPLLRDAEINFTF